MLTPLASIAHVIQELIGTLRSLRCGEVPWAGTLRFETTSVAAETTSATLMVHRWLEAMGKVAVLLEVMHVAIALSNFVGVATASIVAVLVLHTGGVAAWTSSATFEVRGRLVVVPAVVAGNFTTQVVVVRWAARMISLKTFGRSSTALLLGGLRRSLLSVALASVASSTLTCWPLLRLN